MRRLRVLTFLVIVAAWLTSCGTVLAGDVEIDEPAGSPPGPIPFGAVCDPPALPNVWTPPSYVDLRDSLRAQISAFNTSVRSQWNGSRYPVAFSAELNSASGHRARDLLNPSNYWGVILELDSLDALGLRAITVSVSFPLLDSNFTTNSTEYQGYIDFYSQLAADTRARGMKFIIDTSWMFPEYTALPVGPYYANLTYADYLRGRIETAVTLARDVGPDALNLGSEPDTEELITGQPVATPAASTAQVNAILSGIESAGVTGIPISAGVGTWDPMYFWYAVSLGANTNLSAIDVHVYPINNDYLDRAATIADVARFYGKNVTMGEAWLYKARDSELGLGVFYGDIFARDAYSFFAPLDIEMLRMMVAFAHWKQLEYFSPFWEKYFFAYLDYNATIGLTPMQVQFYANLAALDAMLRGVYSITGHAYAVAIDETPPTVPGGFTASPLSSSEVSLIWNASSDNIGVWCYRVFRDGSPIVETTALSYTDAGLSPSTTYAYSVVAYDEAGNPSTAATANATTNPPNMAPTAAFSFNPTAPTVGTTVSFTDSSTDDGAIVAWVWNFGDGGSSTQRNPSHTFSSAGAYVVTLNVTDDGGLTDVAGHMVSVFLPPDMTDPTIAITTPASEAHVTSESLTVAGTAADNVGILRIELSIDGSTWTIANGTTSWSGTVTLSPGINTVYARATDVSGNSATATITITRELPAQPPAFDPLPLLVGFLAAMLIIALLSFIIIIRRRRSRHS